MKCGGRSNEASEQFLELRVDQHVFLDEEEADYPAGYVHILYPATKVHMYG